MELIYDFKIQIAISFSFFSSLRRILVARFFESRFVDRIRKVIFKKLQIAGICSNSSLFNRVIEIIGLKRMHVESFFKLNLQIQRIRISIFP